MIYIVSGFMRCGTSMMMKALEAGGLTAAYSSERDARMNRQWGDVDKPGGYVPNDGYYELDPDDYQAKDFPAAYEGKLIKCLWGGILRLPPGEYRLIFMRRAAREIRTSLLAFFGQPHHFAERPDFDAQMDKIIAIARDRRSFLSVDEIQYLDALMKPEEVFAGLGWPIDPEKAAAVPDANKRRYAA